MADTIDRDAVSTALKEHFGSYVELAARLDVSKQLLHYYLDNHFPLEKALEVDALTGGIISWRDLCPPVYSRLASFQERVRDSRQLELPFDLDDRHTLS
jgi:hypothetical protein